MISMDKKYRTRDGQPVRILCVDGIGECTVWGIIGNSATCSYWNLRGRYAGTYRDFDLVECPETVHIDVWLNVYPSGACDAFRTQDNAEKYAAAYVTPPRIACIHLVKEVEYGAGLKDKTNASPEKVAYKPLSEDEREDGSL